MLKITLLYTAFILTLLPVQAASSRANDQSASNFIADSFDQHPPKPELLWITQALKPEIRNILGHDLNRLRLRYWQQGTRSAWILNEIGKEKPITFGIVVADGQIERLRVLTFRESRGWEIRHPFFTDQFKGATIDGDQQLDQHIDNISGATLSVRAATRIARLALFLHRNTSKQINGITP